MSSPFDRVSFSLLVDSKSIAHCLLKASSFLSFNFAASVSSSHFFLFASQMSLSYLDMLYKHNLFSWSHFSESSSIVFYVFLHSSPSVLHYALAALASSSHFPAAALHFSSLSVLVTLHVLTSLQAFSMLISKFIFYWYTFFIALSHNSLAFFLSYEHFFSDSLHLVLSSSWALVILSFSPLHVTSLNFSILDAHSFYGFRLHSFSNWALAM